MWGSGAAHVRLPTDQARGLVLVGPSSTYPQNCDLHGLEGSDYLLANPCSIHRLLSGLPIAYAKLLASGAKLKRIAGFRCERGCKLLSNALMSRSFALSISSENRNHPPPSWRMP